MSNLFLPKTIFYSICCLLAILMTGLGYLGLTPIYEGFDENAHYSSVRQVSLTGTVPLYGQSFLDRYITDYRGPFAYGSLLPPFDSGMTYGKFFADSTLVQDYLKAYRRGSTSQNFVPTEAINWQAQHPPLFYALLTPLVKATADLSFVSQLLTLRMASWLLAVGGMALALYGAWRGGRETFLPALTGFLIYPLVLPMLFPEFARLGNDSLCLFLIGLLAYLIPLWLKDTTNKKLAVMIGAVLGIGLLTKAFFLLIAIGIGLYLMVPALRGGWRSSWNTARASLWLFVPAVMLGAIWYGYKFVTQGELLGGHEAIQLAELGGFWANFPHKFTISEFARSFLVTIATWSWAGTWSLVRMSMLLQLPLVALAIILLLAYARSLKGKTLKSPEWLTVWILAVFAAGFVHHILISIAINGNGNTPGWYLHILMPWVAPALGLGFIRLWQTPALRLPLIGLLAYALAFHLYALWSSFALYTGCAVKGDDKHYHFTAPHLCLDQWPQMVSNLGVIGWPWLAAIGLGTGIVAAFALLGYLFRRRKADLPMPV